MIRRGILAGIGVLALSTNVMAQDYGGVRLSPGINGGPVGLAKPLLSAPMPYMTARDAQNGMTSSDHQAQNQAMITRLRGDSGYLGGFSMGTPLSASRQVQVASDQSGYGYDGGGGYHHHRQRPIIINNAGPLAVTVGNGNVVQQQSANGSGPIALQQVATPPSAGSSSGALNLVTGGGNIVQRAPGGH